MQQGEKIDKYLDAIRALDEAREKLAAVFGFLMIDGTPMNHLDRSLMSAADITMMLEYLREFTYAEDEV